LHLFVHWDRALSSRAYFLSHILMATTSHSDRFRKGNVMVGEAHNKNIIFTQHIFSISRYLLKTTP
jgi:hypothetical protein